MVLVLLSLVIYIYALDYFDDKFYFYETDATWTQNPKKIFIYSSFNLKCIAGGGMLFYSCERLVTGTVL